MIVCPTDTFSVVFHLGISRPWQITFYSEFLDYTFGPRQTTTAFSVICIILQRPPLDKIDQGIPVDLAIVGQLPSHRVRYLVER